MGTGKLPLSLRFYGMSPWELEVLYGLFHSLFKVEEHPEEEQDENFTTFVEIIFPLAFNDAFFKWFGSPRWEKTKAILKELKRRRGGGKTLRADVRFTGRPNIKFTIDLEERVHFDSAIEKIEFVLELLPYHLDPSKIPKDTTEIQYYFDNKMGRWNMNLIT
jgi:hypothetical protein